ncbi:MAG: hypothetical protein HY332_19760 [Chloroflexi bacterium]|nr:hypothetical protein [Chloroflexota bacterium]
MSTAGCGIKQYKGITRVGHGGAITNFGALFETAPEAGVAVVALYNRLARDFELRAIVDGIFDELLGLPTGAGE